MPVGDKPGGVTPLTTRDNTFAGYDFSKVKLNLPGVGQQGVAPSTFGGNRLDTPNRATSGEHNLHQSKITK